MESDLYPAPKWYNQAVLFHLVLNRNVSILKFLEYHHIQFPLNMIVNKKNISPALVFLIH